MKSNSSYSRWRAVALQMLMLGLVLLLAGCGDNPPTATPPPVPTPKPTASAAMDNTTDTPDTAKPLPPVILIHGYKGNVLSLEAASCSSKVAACTTPRSLKDDDPN